MSTERSEAFGVDREGSTARTEAPASIPLREIMSDHDTESPLTPTELRELAGDIEETLVISEANFSHPEWRRVDGLKALARDYEKLNAIFEALPDILQLTRKSGNVVGLVRWLRELA